MSSNYQHTIELYNKKLKELHGQIDALNEENALLKKKIKELEKQIDELTKPWQPTYDKKPVVWTGNKTVESYLDHIDHLEP